MLLEHSIVAEVWQTKRTGFGLMELSIQSSRNNFKPGQLTAQVRVRVAALYVASRLLDDVR